MGEEELKTYECVSCKHLCECSVHNTEGNCINYEKRNDNAGSQVDKDKHRHF